MSIRVIEVLLEIGMAICIFGIGFIFGKAYGRNRALEFMKSWDMNNQDKK